MFSWLVFGDFDEILWNYEKSGSCLRREALINDFRDTLEECGLDDLGYMGSWFT